MAEHRDWFYCPKCNMQFGVNFYKEEEKVCPCGNLDGLEWVMKEWLGFSTVTTELKRREIVPVTVEEGEDDL